MATTGRPPKWGPPRSSLDRGSLIQGVSTSSSSVGNIGGAITPTLVAYLAMRYGWNVPFMTGSALCLLGAAIYGKIDASKRIFPA